MSGVAFEPFITWNVILCLCAPMCAMFLKSKTLLAGHDHLITPNTEFLMGHYGLSFSGSGPVSANRWNRVPSGQCVHRQNISTDPPSISCQMKKKSTGNKVCHIRDWAWPLMSLWTGCKTDGTFQKPSVHFRVRLKLILSALKEFADKTD